MPIHDWTRVEPGDFHDFHQCWTVEIRNALNRGLLPPDFVAMTDQVTGRPIADVVTLQTDVRQESSGNVKLSPAPAPTARGRSTRRCGGRSSTRRRRIRGTATSGSR